MIIIIIIIIIISISIIIISTTTIPPRLPPPSSSPCPPSPPQVLRTMHTHWSSQRASRSPHIRAQLTTFDNALIATITTTTTTTTTTIIIITIIIIIIIIIIITPMLPPPQVLRTMHTHWSSQRAARSPHIRAQLTTFDNALSVWGLVAYLLHRLGDGGGARPADFLVDERVIETTLGRLLRTPQGKEVGPGFRSAWW
jgi:hypothetical protein